MAATTSEKSSIDRLTKTAHQTVDRLGDRAEELYQMPQDWVESARDYVREHPFASIGMAFAAGYLYRMIRG